MVSVVIAVSTEIAFTVSLTGGAIVAIGFGCELSGLLLKRPGAIPGRRLATGA
jgi:hypothetical protein